MRSLKVTFLYGTCRVRIFYLTVDGFSWKSRGFSSVDSLSLPFYRVTIQSTMMKDF